MGEGRSSLRVERGKGVFLGAVLENELFSLVRLVLELGRGMEKGRCAAARYPG